MSSPPKTRRKPRHRGAQARANTDLQAHIESLGLNTAEEYRAWCREHGFTGALNKDWSERRKERLRAKQLEADAKPDPALLKHLAELGLKTIPEYQAWCRERGLSDSPRKSADQRRKELRAVEQERAEVALQTARRHTRKPSETILALYRRELDPYELNGTAFEEIAHAFRSLKAPRHSRVRDSFLRLLLVAEKTPGLLDLKSVFPALGEDLWNTSVEGLLALARHESSWLREPEAWKPASRSPRKQFGQLARHLLARYPVPSFMDQAWFARDHPEYAEWFKWIGSGRNHRTAPGLPLRLTRMMAHVLPDAPDGLTIPQALRWAQVVGMGGGEELARAVLASRIGDTFENEEFWETVIRFFVDNPMLDPDHVGPIVDYLHTQKYAPVETVDEHGVVETVPPPSPDLSMKGRTVPALLERVEAWHRQLAKEAKTPAQAWKPSGIGGFAWEEPDTLRRWTVTELLTSKQLHAEGQAMSHCVGSYRANCAKGRVSVWSIQVEDEMGQRKRALTIAVKNDTRTLSEARGRHNVSPTGKGGHGRTRTVGMNQQELLKGGRTVMQLWASREGLRMHRNA